MKGLLLAITGLMLTTFCFAQNVYQIRADSVRIYNTCDTAELILENRTQDTLDFLYNKGKGRTEFRRLQLEMVEGSKLAITGQDTAGQTITIPTAASATGRVLFLRNLSSTNAVALSQSYVQNDSQTVSSLAASAGVLIQSNGTSWYRIGF